MAFRLPFRRQPVAPPPTVTAKPPARSAIGAVFGSLWAGLSWLCASIDYAFSCLAVPFGVRIRDPKKRYPVLLGVFALLFAIGTLHIQLVPLIALGAGYVGVLAIGRAWVSNEKERTAIVKKLKDANPDQLPDLRWTALVSALMLLILFPLLFQQVQWHYQLFKVDGTPTLGDWFWFCLDKTYLKALPDWSILYGVHISSIDVKEPWSRHLVLLSRLTFDYILIQGVLRVLAIRATIGEAVAAVKADPDIAVRLGRRAVGPLLVKLRDPDKAVRGGAASALMQLGEGHRIGELSEKTQE